MPIIPHDMVHYAVESMLSHHGSLSMVAEGQAAAFTTQGGEAEEAIERLLESFQAEMWGGRVPATDLIATYEHAFDARGHASAPVTTANVEAIRSRLDELTEAWAAVPVNGSMTLRF